MMQIMAAAFAAKLVRDKTKLIVIKLNEGSAYFNINMAIAVRAVIQVAAIASNLVRDNHIQY